MTHRGHSHTTLVYGFTQRSAAATAIIHPCLGALSPDMSDKGTNIVSVRLSQGNHPATGYVTGRGRVTRCDQMRHRLARTPSKERNVTIRIPEVRVWRITSAISSDNVTQGSTLTTYVTPASRDITGHSTIPVADCGRTGESLISQASRTWSR